MAPDLGTVTSEHKKTWSSYLEHAYPGSVCWDTREKMRQDTLEEYSLYYSKTQENSVVLPGACLKSPGIHLLRKKLCKRQDTLENKAYKYQNHKNTYFLAWGIFPKSRSVCFDDNNTKCKQSNAKTTLNVNNFLACGRTPWRFSNKQGNRVVFPGHVSKFEELVAWEQ